MNNGFPFRQQPAPKPRASINLDDQIACQCGEDVFIPASRIFKVPGQIVGTWDITFGQVFYCRKCGEVIQVDKAPTRKDVQERVKAAN